MSCTLEREEQLNELLDGHLAPAEAEAVTRHLADCAACADTHAGLQELAQRVAGLEPSVATERDLWPALRQRLEAESRFRPRPVAGWGMALAAGLLAAGVIIGLQLGRTLPAGTPAAPAGGPVQVMAAAAGPLSGLRAAEAEFLRATEALLAQMENRRHNLAPAQVAAVEDSLAVIRRAIDEVWAALEAEPGNMDNAVRLVGLYRTQVRLLKDTVPAQGESL